MNEKYESILFDPKDMDNDWVYVLIESDNEFQVLHTKYDTCLDRFFPSEKDTLHTFDSRATAFRYLTKRTRVRDSLPNQNA